jgi:hypothetical protein
MDKIAAPILLVDGDIFAYRAAAASDGRMYSFTYEGGTVRRNYKKDIVKERDALLKTGVECTDIVQTFEPDPVEYALHTLKKSIESLETDLELHIDGCGAKEVFLTNGDSFRNTEVYAGYKKNRDDMRKPLHLNDCKQYLVNKYGATARPGELEADDMIAMRATELLGAGAPYIIVSLDKDLKQIEGYHWNFQKKELTYVDSVEAKRNLYKQVLIGDPTDGIPGLYGVGPKRAEVLLAPLQEERHMYLVCLKEYLDKMPKTVENHEEFCANLMHTHAHLLYLLRKEGERWVPPSLD